MAGCAALRPPRPRSLREIPAMYTRGFLFNHLGLTLGLLILLPQVAGADAVERMSLEKLRATHERIEALKKARHPVTLVSGYDDVRTLLHVHSAFSHDSRGTLDEILAAAKETGV